MQTQPPEWLVAFREKDYALAAQLLEPIAVGGMRRAYDEYKERPGALRDFANATFYHGLVNLYLGSYEKALTSFDAASTLFYALNTSHNFLPMFGGYLAALMSEVSLPETKREFRKAFVNEVRESLGRSKIDAPKVIGLAAEIVRSGDKKAFMKALTALGKYAGEGVLVLALAAYSKATDVDIQGLAPILSALRERGVLGNVSVILLQGVVFDRYIGSSNGLIPALHGQNF